MRYVTYDPTTGGLTGSYLQDLLPEHEANHLVIDDVIGRNWPAYRANAARSGVELVPPPPIDLAAVSAALIVKIDVDVDAIYAAVIGNRSDEYNAANADATAYKAAGYNGTVPPSVQSWATAKSWTPTQAADDVLAAAARLTTLRDNIRAQRLAKKEAARVATTKTALDTIAAQWSAALAALRTAAGL